VRNSSNLIKMLKDANGNCVQDVQMLGTPPTLSRC
jgi:hypothetical protein